MTDYANKNITKGYCDLNHTKRIGTPGVLEEDEEETDGENADDQERKTIKTTERAVSESSSNSSSAPDTAISQSDVASRHSEAEKAKKSSMLVPRFGME